jgi:hypothetical protein
LDFAIPRYALYHRESNPKENQGVLRIVFSHRQDIKSFSDFWDEIYVSSKEKVSQKDLGGKS